MSRGILIAVLILVVLAIAAASVSFMQGSGVNRENASVQDLEGTTQP